MAIKRKTKKTAAHFMDYDQTIIPGHIYQSWLQDVSDLISRRGRKRKVHLNLISNMKFSIYLILCVVNIDNEYTSELFIYYLTNFARN